MNKRAEIEVTLPIRTVSEANDHSHWRNRQRRAKAQRRDVAIVPACSLPCVVTLTRISPGLLDDDNLRPALKHVRDGIAARLGLPNDRDPRVTWHYHQERGKGFAVRIRMEPAA